MDKAVCYCATRIIYTDIVPSVRSLIENGNIDKVYLIVEDDAHPTLDILTTEFPNKIVLKNVSNDSIFNRSSPYYYTYWTYMVLYRCALHRVFPELARILSLDADTIILRDISCLWEMDFGDNLLAAVKEPFKSDEHSGRLYINGGVQFWNLAKLRESGIGDKMIDMLNHRAGWGFPDQDCIAANCKGRIAILEPEFNSNNFTKIVSNPRIVHFAGVSSTVWRRYEEVLRYSKGVKLW